MHFGQYCFRQTICWPLSCVCADEHSVFLIRLSDRIYRQSIRTAGHYHHHRHQWHLTMVFILSLNFFLTRAPNPCPFNTLTKWNSPSSPLLYPLYIVFHFLVFRQNRTALMSGFAHVRSLHELYTSSYCPFRSGTSINSLIGK